MSNYLKNHEELGVLEGVRPVDKVTPRGIFGSKLVYKIRNGEVLAFFVQGLPASGKTTYIGNIMYAASLNDIPGSPTQVESHPMDKHFTEAKAYYGEDDTSKWQDEQWERPDRNMRTEIFDLLYYGSNPHGIVHAYEFPVGRKRTKLITGFIRRRILEEPIKKRKEVYQLITPSGEELFSYANVLRTNTANISEDYALSHLLDDLAIHFRIIVMKDGQDARKITDAQERERIAKEVYWKIKQSAPMHAIQSSLEEYMHDASQWFLSNLAAGIGTRNNIVLPPSVSPFATARSRDMYTNMAVYAYHQQQPLRRTDGLTAAIFNPPYRKANQRGWIYFHV